jgi:TonB-linked SusC/RagA family outer membrane protein
LLAVLLAGPAPLWAQTGAISGTVFGALTERPVAGVRVQVVGTVLAAMSGPDGKYTIREVPAGTHTVRASAIGYARRDASITVGAGEVAAVDFRLTTAAINLEEIVVTGTAGATEKRQIGNAVTGLDVSTFTDIAPINSVQELLAARAPGLTIFKSSGLAGTGSNVQIRGPGSLNASYVPVYYIDGIRFEATPVTVLGNNNSTLQFSSPLDFIDPADIERVEVIKGPAAATLYGADAAGGVIQIITKKGLRGAGVQWSASVETSESEWVRRTPTTYWECTPLRIRDTLPQPGAIPRYPGCNDPASIEWTGPNGSVTGIPESDILRYGDSSFVLTDNPLQRHPHALRPANAYDTKLSVRGGGELFNYYLSFNRMNEDGIFFNNFQARTGGRANFEFTPTDKLNLAANFGYTRTNFQLPLSDNSSSGLLRNSYRGKARGTRDPWESGFLTFGPDQTNEYDARVAEERTTIGITVNFNPLPWLQNRIVFGLDKYDRRDTEFFRIDSTAKWGSDQGTGQITQRLPLTNTWTADYSGSALARLSPDLTATTSAGFQLNARQYRRFTLQGTGLVANSVNLIGTAKIKDASEGFEEQTSLGMYFQEKVGWRDRLFVTGALRIDDNSAFGSNFSLVTYPKASVAYVISEESFFNVPQVDELKLRFAWGQAGNAPQPFVADRTVTTDVTTVDDAPVNALRPSEFGNPDLRAETGQEWELGFDASLFAGKLGLEVTYYRQQTKDALMAIPDPPSSGFNGEHFVNIGEIANRGFELLATASPVQRPNVSWDVSLSFATNSNELVSFGGSRTEVQFGAFTNSQRHREGYPLGGFWAVDVVRDANGAPVLNANGQATADLTCSWPDPVDADGYGGSCHERFVGPSTPTREIGFSNTLTLFGTVRVFAHFDYKGGFYQVCAICSINNRVDQNTWGVNNPQGNPVQKAVLLSQQTETYIMPADFLKLREVAVSYTLPSSWGGPFARARWNVTVAARNLWVTTKYGGYGDPEVLWAPRGDTRYNNFEVLDYASVPQPRRLSASVSVNF